MKIKKINLNRGKGDIPYFIHLRRLKLIENRDNSFKVFNKKYIDNPSKLQKIESEIKINHSILQKKLPIFNNMSFEFISQFKEIRKIETERLKNSNKILKNILNNLKIPKLKASNSQIMYKSSSIKLKKKIHSLPYMRFFKSLSLKNKYKNLNKLY